MKIIVILLLLLGSATFAQKPKATKDTSKVKITQIGMEKFISVDVEPRPIENIQAKVVYPEGAKMDVTHKDVIVSALIDTNGKVIRTRIERSAGAAFDTAAVKGLRQIRFTPATSDGIPVKLWYTVPIRFKRPE